MTGPQPGSMGARLLAVADACPRTLRDLRQRAEERFGPYPVRNPQQAIQRLCAGGLLKITGRAPSATGRPARLYVLTQAGQTEVDRLSPPVAPHPLRRLPTSPHLRTDLLSVACLTPLSTDDLLERAEAYDDAPGTLHRPAVAEAVRSLLKLGFLAHTGTRPSVRGGRPLNLYTLTPAGETELSHHPVRPRRRSP